MELRIKVHGDTFEVWNRKLKKILEINDLIEFWVAQAIMGWISKNRWKESSKESDPLWKTNKWDGKLVTSKCLNSA